MTLDRGRLSRIDRRIFAELGQDLATQAVKVPLNDATWSTWRRYCQELELTMGEGVAGLIVHELQTVVDEVTDVGVPVFAAGGDDELASRESQVAARERDLARAEERLSGWTGRLGIWERELHAWEQRLDQGAKLAAQARTADRKVGRNEPCPCGSGRKYKYCHGMPGRRT